LMIAAFKGNQEIIRALLEKGADTGARDNDGLTAEKWAIKGGRDETAKMLRENSRVGSPPE
jgi:ankyrin repeat protein